MDWLSNVYLGCFIFGLIFAVASFLLGGLDHFGVGGHDAGGIHPGGHTITSSGGARLDLHLVSPVSGNHPGGQAHSHAPANPRIPHERMGWFNFNALVVFVTWFGGAGFILKSLQFSDALSGAGAVASGCAGYMAVLLFMSKVLISSQTPVMRAADYDLTGTVARVSGTIFEKGTGEILFSKHGSRRAVPARSVDGSPFSIDSQVVVLRFENGIAYVDDLDRLLAEAGAEKWSTAKLDENN